MWRCGGEKGEGGGSAGAAAAGGAGVGAAVMQVEVRAVHAVQGGTRGDPPGVQHEAGVLPRSVEVQVQGQDVHALDEFL